MKHAVILSLLALTAGLSQAQTAPPPHLFVGLDAGAGGDTLVSVPYTDGSHQDIRAGNGVQLKGGVEFQVGPNSAIQASLGYHFYTTNASNGSVTFTRWPIEVLALWQVNSQLRLGGGVRMATGAKLESSGAASGYGNYSFGANPGLVLEGEFLITPRIGLTLRAVSEKYNVDGGVGKVSGDHAAVGLNFYF
jgi:hypothetical protein